MNRNTDKGSILIDTVYTEEMLQDFTVEEAGEIFLALLANANRGEEFETDDRSMRTLYRTIQSTIDKSNERYEEKCERNRQIALNREKKRKETKKEDEHERARTYTNVHERTKTDDEEHDEHERARTSPIMIISNKEPKGSNKEPKGSMLEQSSNVVLEANNAHDTRARDEAGAGKKNHKIDYAKVRNQFNRIMKAEKIPKIKGKISGQRQAFFEARAREYGIISAYRVMIKAARSNFLNGGGEKGWTATFEWIFRPNNFPKVLDGYYDDQQPITTQSSKKHETTKQTATASRERNYNAQRTAEQRERIQGYAGVASKWRQIAESGATAVEHEAKPT